MTGWLHGACNCCLVGSCWEGDPAACDNANCPDTFLVTANGIGFSTAGLPECTCQAYTGSCTFFRNTTPSLSCNIANRVCNTYGGSSLWDPWLPSWPCMAECSLQPVPDDPQWFCDCWRTELPPELIGKWYINLFSGLSGLPIDPCGVAPYGGAQIYFVREGGTTCNPIGTYSWVFVPGFTAPGMSVTGTFTVS